MSSHPIVGLLIRVENVYEHSVFEHQGPTTNPDVMLVQSDAKWMQRSVGFAEFCGGAS